MNTPDKSDAADARRMRWLLDGNGYFMEEERLCGYGPCDEAEQDAARAAIDAEMQDDRPRNPVNKKAPGTLAIGDYVFASRWTDCTPGNPWAIGHVSAIGAHCVVVGDASERQWPNAMKITAEQAQRIMAAYPAMEDAPTNLRAVAEVWNLPRNTDDAPELQKSQAKSIA